jgi:hypothetical protein
VFSYKEHLPNGGAGAPKLTFVQSIRHIFDVSDVSATVFDHVQTVATTTINFRGGRSEHSEKAALLSNDHLSSTPPSEGVATNYGTGSNV